MKRPANSIPEPSTTTNPANTAAPVYPALEAINAPAIGGPDNSPSPLIVTASPKRAPNCDMSGVTLPIVAGGREMNAPEKNP